MRHVTLHVQFYLYNLHVQFYIYVYIYIHTHAHVHTHTLSHTHTQSPPPPPPPKHSPRCNPKGSWVPRLHQLRERTKHVPNKSINRKFETTHAFLAGWSTTHMRTSSPLYPSTAGDAGACVYVCAYVCVCVCVCVCV